jgi:hypothetical protein
MALDLIICRLNVKNAFGEVDEAMFEGVQIQSEIIFCIHIIRKGDLDDVA